MYLSYVSATIGVVIAVACAWYCRRLAARKGRSVPFWTVAGLVLTVVAVPVLYLAPAAEQDAPRDGERTGGGA